MFELTRTQMAVYAALAIAGLLLGAKWIRSAGDASASSGPAAVEPAGGVEVRRGAGGVTVHVAGAVERPGVYRLPAGSRVADAVKRAGGPTRSGSADAINLAAIVADGQQIIVPARAGAGAAAAPGAATGDGPISLGTATAEQLEQIEGIGPVTAAEIIAFRDRHGGLASIDQLDEIHGIGPATMEALRARLQP